MDYAGNKSINLIPLYVHFCITQCFSITQRKTSIVFSLIDKYVSNTSITLVLKDGNKKGICYALMYYDDLWYYDDKVVLI